MKKKVSQKKKKTSSSSAKTSTKASAKKNASVAVSSLQQQFIQARANLPAQVERFQSILSEKAVDVALPLTKMLQAKLSLLENKLNRV